ncbi:MAG: TMEM165/GDT1 family protein [Candidatus Marinimicrobia bacterium]|nr:TMEM165/GDT1 family protein [Candidatus Neomarinimicrobiota bacterium]
MKAIWIAFGTIFIAELGDKTQLAVLALKSKGLSGWGLFTGSMIAFAVLTGLAIIFGDLLHQHINPVIIEKVAAVAFVVIGILMYFGKL